MILIQLLGCTHMESTLSDRERAKLYLQMAADQFAARQFARSIETTEKALAVDPQFAPAYSHLGLIYMETKRYQKAEQAFAKAAELQPGYPDVQNNWGVLLNREERYDEAIAHFKAALRDDKYATPENALTNMGYAHYKLGQLAKAKLYHQKALEVMPQFCLANKNLGDVYAKERNFGRAEEYFRKALASCPLYPEAHYKLAVAIMQSGNRRMAKSELQGLIDRYRHGPYVERSQEILKYLR